MPPKMKLHKSAGKMKSLPTRDSENPAEPQLSPEAARQFEFELCWCIQQLQTALKLGKLNSKQVQDHTKALNTLMSHSSSLVKKRQVMRLSFGDYRAKMAIEDKKSNAANSKIKINQANPSNKSVFLKKASDNSFRFNFPMVEENIADDMSNVIIDDNREQNELVKASTSWEKENFNFQPSNNQFRFNFDVSS